MKHCFLVICLFSFFALYNSQYLLVQEYNGPVDGCSTQNSPWIISTLYLTNYCFFDEDDGSGELYSYDPNQPSVAVMQECETSDCQDCNSTQIPLTSCIEGNINGSFAIWTIVNSVNNDTFPSLPFNSTNFVSLSFSDLNCQDLVYAQTGNLTCSYNGDQYVKQSCTDNTEHVNYCTDDTCTSCKSAGDFPVDVQCAPGGYGSGRFACQ